jgi:dolichyl-phosphate beta-glucosyltransferase
LPESLALSLVLPAYNEAARLPSYLVSIRRHLQRRYPDRYEVIVVDDGGTDGLQLVLAQAAASWPQLRWIRHARNQGKGAAVRTGILAARGQLVLFADADGATPISEESRLAAAIRDGADLAVGSRLVAAAGTRRSRNWLRALVGRMFALVARRLLRLPVRDTQCGFKMFRGDVARELFSMLRERGYLFDLEVLGLANRLGYRTVEVPVDWAEVPGGHFSPLRQVPKLVADLRRIVRRLRSAPARTGKHGR